MKRLKVFEEQTKPVIDHYTSLNKVVRIDANRSIEAITADAESHLDSLGIFPQ